MLLCASQEFRGKIKHLNSYVQEFWQGWQESYRGYSTSPKSPPLTSFKGLYTVTVGAPYFAFGNFGLYFRPGSCILDERCYIVGLITMHMVKLKTADIGLTAIYTGMRG
jgi:hypothetical protein